MSALTQSAAWFRDELELLGRNLSGALDSIQKHRQAKADEFIRPYLAQFSEQELAERGFGEADVAKIKAAAGRIPPHFL